MTEERREIAEVLLADRQFIYSLLHKVFGRDPDAELIDILISDNTAQAFSILSDDENDIFAKIPLFIEEVKSDMAKDEKFMDKLKTEYTKLFIGPLELVAPPWESIYVGDEATLFQESTLKVRQFYRSYGLIPEGYPRVADDSLALEMAFMSELATRALNAFEEDNLTGVKNLLEGSALFLKSHLLVWIPKFLKKMANSPSDYLYPQMCLILDYYLKKDAEIVKAILTEI